MLTWKGPGLRLRIAERLVRKLDGTAFSDKNKGDLEAALPYVPQPRIDALPRYYTVSLLYMAGSIAGSNSTLGKMML